MPGKPHRRHTHPTRSGMDQHHSPDFRPPRSNNPYQAVKNANGTEAACANVHPSGKRLHVRKSDTTSGPNDPVASPITRSPTANPDTPRPTSTTTPAASSPGSPGSPGYIPNTFSTSRKLTRRPEPDADLTGSERDPLQ